MPGYEKCQCSKFSHYPPALEFTYYLATGGERDVAHQQPGLNAVLFWRDACRDRVRIGDDVSEASGRLLDLVRMNSPVSNTVKAFVNT